ncbi:hypothetical protein MBLNU230_g6020t1 [Neophaeotheca triangularis]
MATPTYFTCTLGQAAAQGNNGQFSSVPDLLSKLASETPTQQAISFPLPGDNPQDPWTNLIYTFQEIRNGTQRVASKLKTLSESRSTIALICPSTPDFLFTWLGLMWLGHAVLLIAPQCQPAAIKHLCAECGVEVLLYDSVYESQALEAAKLAGEGLRTVDVVEACNGPVTESARHGSIESIQMAEVAESDVAYLHHTSGTSSGVPKPIPQTHRAGVGVLPSLPGSKDAASFTTTPLYHGGVADVFRAWSSGAMIVLFPGKGVPITGSNVVKCLSIAGEATETAGLPQIKYFSSVPYVLQSLEADEQGLKYLQQMDMVGVGGAALPAEVGDRLVRSGINLISRFGSAECGFLMSSQRHFDKDTEWQYLRSDSGAEHIRFEPQTDGLCELVVLPGWPHMAKRNREDGSFATSDLFAPHPTIANAWRYHSRADSQLTLVTGKKFDPAPLEDSITAASSKLDSVLIFGNGQPYPGALLFRSAAAREDSDAELLEQLWPVVSKLNSESQDHARLSKDMLVPMPALETPLEKSSKGTIIRGAAEKRFRKNIDGAYELPVDEASRNVNDEDLPQAIKAMIQKVLPKDQMLTEQTDLFSFGVDSVAGMQIRHRLRQLLPTSAGPLPINVVEDCGNIEKLAEYIARRRRGEDVSNSGNEHDYMRRLVQEYSVFANAGERNGTANGVKQEDKEIIVLTGATGALGAHILAQYRNSPSVSKIYCLVRGADENAAFERVNKALLQRKLSPLATNTDTAVEVVQAQLSDERLGLSTAQYDQISREATTIMHVAWSVNFRMKLRSFVKDNIAGVRNLVDLALASPKRTPPRFAFCSSVASVMASELNPIPELLMEDPASATELGYSQSKWVAEQICNNANSITRLRGRVSVFRVGQLAGDSVHGVWNEKEAWPMMLSAVKVTGSLPLLEHESLDWLPVDRAATALIEGAAYRDGQGELQVFHVINEHRRPKWTAMLGWLRKLEEFREVAPSQWTEELESASRSGSEHPSLQLLDHWKQAYAGKDRNTDGGKGQHESGDIIKAFSMSRTKEALPALRDVPPVSEEYFTKLWTWIRENV